MADAAKKVKFLAKSLNTDRNALTFKLGNGLEVVGTLDELSDEIRTQLAWHGLSQKVGDAAAGFSKTLDYKGAYAAMLGVWDSLCEGVWAVKGANSDMAEALVRLKMADDVEAASDLIAGLDEETLKGVTSHPAVKAEIAKIKAERANAALQATADKAIDLTALFKKAEPEGEEE